jgi:folylpolyglutamate synthase/dihydropteroate synthase
VIKAVEESAGKAFAIGYDSIQKGLAQARIPWRMEVAGRDPFVILDGAHNRESWENLRQTLANFPFQNLHAIVAIQKLKTPEDFPKNLPGKEVFLHLPRIPGPAFHSPQHLTQALSGFQGKIILHPDTPSALSHITPILQKDDLLLVTGTFKLAPYLRSRQSFHIPDLSCGS